MNINFVQIVKQTDEEKLAMYMKCKKIELAKMLIECNKIIEINIKPTVDLSKIERDFFNS